MTVTASLSLLKWVAFSVLAGLAVPGLLLVVITFPIPGNPVLLLILLELPILLALPLMVVPFLALRPNRLWWPASLAGLFVGLVGGFILLRFVFGLTFGCFILFSPSAGQECVRNLQRSAIWTPFTLVSALAVMGLLQALTLSRLQRKIGWFVTTLVGAFAFVYGFVGVGFAFGGTRASPANLWVAAFLAGALWGIVAGIGLTILTSWRQSVAAVA